MTDSVTIVECPRDAWQGLPGRIPADIKAKYLGTLIDAGCTHLDAVSFVSPAAVPQMGDSEEVLKLLAPAASVEIIGIVANERGARRAIATGRGSTLGFPYSASPRFLKRNQNQTLEEAITIFGAIRSLAHSAGLGIVTYLSMAFGNPYGEMWSVEDVLRVCGELIDSGVRQISLADTVGIATCRQIYETVEAVTETYREIEIGVHLHARRDEAPDRIRAAFEAGCRRFDSAIGGLGGCPFAQDEMVGNIPTEMLVETLEMLGARLTKLRDLDGLIQANAEIAEQFGVHSRS